MNLWVDLPAARSCQHLAHKHHHHYQNTARHCSKPLFYCSQLSHWQQEALICVPEVSGIDQPPVTAPPPPHHRPTTQQLAPTHHYHASEGESSVQCLVVTRRQVHASPPLASPASSFLPPPSCLTFPFLPLPSLHFTPLHSRLSTLISLSILLFPSSKLRYNLLLQLRDAGHYGHSLFSGTPHCHPTTIPIWPFNQSVTDTRRKSDSRPSSWTTT